MHTRDIHGRPKTPLFYYCNRCNHFKNNFWHTLQEICNCMSFAVISDNSGEIQINLGYWSNDVAYLASI